MGDLRFGHIRGPVTTFPCPMTDSETVKLRSGRFVTRNASTGAFEIADTTEDVWGWVEPDDDGDGSVTTSSSTFLGLDGNDAVFRIPLIYDGSTYTVNFSQAIVGECCDLKVVSGVQYANPTAATNKSLLIVDGKAATGTTVGTNDGYLDVKINGSARANLGVGA